MIIATLSHLVATPQQWIKSQCQSSLSLGWKINPLQGLLIGYSLNVIIHWNRGRGGKHVGTDESRGAMTKAAFFSS